MTVSRQNFVAFLQAVRADGGLRDRYRRRDLTRLVFHAKNDGYDFTAADVADVVGGLESSVVLTKDREPFDGSSRLWRQMWGRPYLDYVVDHLIARHTDEELRALTEGEQR